MQELIRGDPCDGINFLSGEEDYIINDALFTQGSGILVIEGDLVINGNLNFTGIIWITGVLVGLGNSHVIGAIFAAGAELSDVQGSFLLEFDGSVNNYDFTNREGKGPFEVLAVYKDYRNQFQQAYIFSTKNSSPKKALFGDVFYFNKNLKYIYSQ